MIGDFNGWSTTANPMELRPEAGVWEAVVPDIGAGSLYKYHVSSRGNVYQAAKADPYGFGAELRPETASKFACWTMRGAMANGWEPGNAANLSHPPFRFTKSI